MTITINKDKCDAIGVCTVKQVCKINGKEVDFSDKYVCTSSVKSLGDVIQKNLVVTSGRSALAKSIGGLYQSASQVPPFLNTLAIGTGVKSGNLPNLSDVALVQELQNLSGSAAGTFLLADAAEVSPDITFPASVARFPTASTGWASSNATIAIDVNGDTILEDLTVDFTAEGVQRTDQVKINNSASNPFIFGIKEIISTTQLKLHNPNGYETPGITQIEYRIDSPGTQVLVSKLISGNDFAVATFGPVLVIKEAALFMSNGSMFNRVVFAPLNEDAGVIIQSDTTNGVELSVRFEWLITF
jgi:hypothetical protein